MINYLEVGYISSRHHLDGLDSYTYVYISITQYGRRATVADCIEPVFGAEKQ